MELLVPALRITVPRKEEEGRSRKKALGFPSRIYRKCVRGSPRGTIFSVFTRENCPPLFEQKQGVFM